VIVTTLGTGGAWSAAGVWHTCNLIERSAGKHLLIDCGGDIRHALRQAMVNPDSIGGIWISHMHGDHIDGLEFFAFNRYCRGLPKPTVYVHERMLGDLKQVFDPKLKHFQDFKTLTFEDYFDVVTFADAGFLYEDDLVLVPVVFPHINPLNPMLVGNSVGVQVTDQEGSSVLFTTDTRTIDFADPTFKLHAAMYDSSDLIVQDCSNYEGSVVHASFAALTRYPDRIRKKMLLTHCDWIGSHWVEKAGFFCQAESGFRYRVTAQRETEKLRG
jgi:ribonuclease BN (tRNA processing enzyme)